VRFSPPGLRCVARLAILLVSLAGHAVLASSSPSAPPGSADARVTAVDSVALTVSDVDRSMTFYTQVLDFRVESDREVSGEGYEQLFGVFGVRVRVARLALGDEHLELLQFLTPRGRPIPVDAHANDRDFQHVAIIVSDMAAAYARLRRFKVEHASTGPQRLPDWNPNAGGIEAFYFRDPDGHFLEVLSFPPGKGSAKWHSGGSRLFLGIDHTAIVVADTEASLRYYHDILGMRLAGTSENFGTEQEHLNNVFGARLRISTLRLDSGPGVELLEYLTPRDGREAPVDGRATDLWYWQVNFRAPDPAASESVLRAAHAQFVSSRTVELNEAALGFHSGVIARDPDGHADLIAH